MMIESFFQEKKITLNVKLFIFFYILKYKKKPFLKFFFKPLFYSFEDAMLFNIICPARHIFHFEIFMTDEVHLVIYHL